MNKRVCVNISITAILNVVVPGCLSICSPCLNGEKVPLQTASVLVGYAAQYGKALLVNGTTCSVSSSGQQVLCMTMDDLVALVSGLGEERGRWVRLKTHY